MVPPRVFRSAIHATTLRIGGKPMYERLIESYKRECEASASALGWGTAEQAREHEERAGKLWTLLSAVMGEDELKREVWQ